MKLLAVLYLALACVRAEAKEIPLKWKAIKGAVSYQLQVGKNEDFGDLVFNKKLKSNSLSYDLKSGIYYLRVQALDHRGKPGHWSKPFKLVVTAPVKPSTDKITEEISYADKPSPVVTDWKAPEKAPKYFVKIMRNGREVDSMETTAPTIHFVPKEPGEYEVVVQAGLDKYFGPPVIVKKFAVAREIPKEVPKQVSEKQIEVPETPKVALSPKTHFSNKKPVELALPKTPEAKYYDITLYKVDDRSPAGEKIPVATKRVRDPSVGFGKLPPGRYTASVSPNGVGNQDAPLSEYAFNVRKEKPVEFEKVDLSFKYNFRQINYSNTIIEAGKSANTTTLGGELNFTGTLWFPESSFGLRADGHWGNMLIEGSYISIDELQFLGTYRKMLGLINADLTAFFGPRVWSMPMIVKDTGGNSAQVTILTPTFLGPAIGFDLSKQLNPRWFLIGEVEFSQPLTYTSFSNMPFPSNLNFSLNSRLKLGARYALNQHSSFIGEIGYQQDQFAYNPLMGNQGSAPPSGSITQDNMSGLVTTVGFEVTDETAAFSVSPTAHEIFSDLDFTMRYAVVPLSYDGTFAEQSVQGKPSNVNFTCTSGSFDTEVAGFFSDSKHGLRFNANWSGYSVAGANISYPEFVAQWGYRTDLTKRAAFQFRNYLGVRAWQVPILNIQNGQTQFLSLNPELLGPADTVSLRFRLGETWSTTLKGELSVPMIVANKDSYIDQFSMTPLSWKAGVDITKEINEDLSAGLSLNYRVDQTSYTMAGASSGTPSSSVVFTAPSAGIFGTYSF